MFSKHSILEAAKPLHCPRVTIDGVVAGLRAEFERSAHFEGDFDLARAITAYRRVTDLLVPRLPELRRRAGLPEKPLPFAGARAKVTSRTYARTSPPTDRVYTFWNRPIGDAPPLVQACLANMRRVYPHLQVLDGQSARALIDIPAYVSETLEQHHIAHFTDYVRTRILEEHGGVWLDSTAWVDRDLGPQLQRLLVTGTVYPRWMSRQIANWFIASHPGTTVITLQRLALDMWWEENDDLPDYFLYHRIFEVLLKIVPEFRGQWEATPWLPSTHCHLMQWEMMQPYVPAVKEGILRVSPLQKLSYKFDSAPQGSLLEHLISVREP